MIAKPYFGLLPKLCFKFYAYCLSRTYPGHLRLVALRLIHHGYETLGVMFRLAVVQYYTNPQYPPYVGVVGGSTYGAFVPYQETRALLTRLLDQVGIKFAMIGLHYCRSGRLDYHVLGINGDGDGTVLVRQLRVFRAEVRKQMWDLVYELNRQRLANGLPSIGMITPRGQVEFMEREADIGLPLVPQAVAPEPSHVVEVPVPPVVPEGQGVVAPPISISDAVPATADPHSLGLVVKTITPQASVVTDECLADIAPRVVSEVTAFEQAVVVEAPAPVVVSQELKTGDEECVADIDPAVVPEGGAPGQGVGAAALVSAVVPQESETVASTASTVDPEVELGTEDPASATSAASDIQLQLDLMSLDRLVVFARYGAAERERKKREEEENERLKKFRLLLLHNTPLDCPAPADWDPYLKSEEKKLPYADRPRVIDVIWRMISWSTELEFRSDDLDAFLQTAWRVTAEYRMKELPPVTTWKEIGSKMER
jgi:hypothetical protein